MLFRIYSGTYNHNFRPIHGGATGSFSSNEVVTGSISGTTARVEKWNYTNVLDLSNISGTFLVGEILVGSRSGAEHKIIFIDTEPTDDGYADNFNIGSRSR